jgi:hypothetical protein
MEVHAITSLFSGKKIYVKRQFANCYVCMHPVLYEYMDLLKNAVYNMFVNTQLRIKIHRKFYQSIIYIVNEGRHVRIVLKINDPQLGFALFCFWCCFV